MPNKAIRVFLIEPLIPTKDRKRCVISRLPQI